jgi:hypothetical protein
VEAAFFIDGVQAFSRRLELNSRDPVNGDPAEFHVTLEDYHAFSATGTHTVGVQVRNLADSGPSLDAGETHTLRVLRFNPLVTADGSTPSVDFVAEQSSTFGSGLSTTFAPVSGLSSTFTVSDTAERYRFSAELNFVNNSTASSTHVVEAAFFIDGVQAFSRLLELNSRDPVNGDPAEFHVTLEDLAFSTTGTHTVDVRVRNLADSGPALDGGETHTLRVLRFKPMPRVTGNVPSVDFVAEQSSTFGSSLSSAFTPVSGLSSTFTVSDTAERYRFSAELNFANNSTASSTHVVEAAFFIDGVQAFSRRLELNSRDPVNGDPAEFHVTLEDYHAFSTTGTHTVEVQVRNVSDTGPALDGGQTHTLRVLRFSARTEQPQTEISLDASNNLVIDDIASGGKRDTLTIQSDTANSQFIIADPNNVLHTAIAGATVSTDSHTIFVPFAAVTGTQILANTGEGDDNLTVDFSLGNFDKAISYDGGAQTTADSLTLSGGPTFASVAHTLASASAGTIDVAGNAQISYSGLEPVTDNLSATDRVFTFTGGAETITLTDAAGANTTMIDSTLGESVTFATPSSSLTINAGTGDDTLSIQAVDPNFSTNSVDLTINGDGGNDAINFEVANTQIGGGALAANGETINNTAHLIATGGITFTADAMSLGVSATGDFLDAGSSGIVTLRPQTSGTAIDLGGGDAPGTLGLSDFDLDRVIAGTIRVGSTSAGAVTVSQAIFPANSPTLHVITGAGVTQSAAINVISGLAIEAGGPVTLPINNAADKLAIRTSVGNIRYQDINALTVDTVDGVAGVGTLSGGVSLFAGSNLVVSDTSAAHDVEGTAGFNTNLVVFSGKLSLVSGANVQGGGADFSANQMDLAGTVTTTASVSLRQINTTQLIDLGSTTDAAAGTLELSDAELDRITTSALQIGVSNGGAITISAPINPANTSTLSLSTGAGVSQTAPITVANLAVRANNAVSLGGVANDVDRLAVSTQAFAAEVSFRDIDGLTVDSVDNLNGVSAPQGSVVITANDGDLTIANTSAAADVSTGFTVNLTAGGNDRLLTIAGGANVQSNMNGGFNTFRADKMRLDGTITAPTGLVALLPQNNSEFVNLGSTTDAAADTLELSDAELDRVTAGTIRVGSTSGNGITISQAIDTANTQVLRLIAGPSGITQTATLREQNLAIVSGLVALTSAGNNFDTVAVASTSGTVFLRDNGGFAVGTVDFLDGITAAGPVTLVSGATTGDGSITVHNTAAASDIVGLGVEVNVAAGGLLTIESGANVKGLGDSHVYVTDRMDLAGTITATGQTVFIRPTSFGAIDLGSSSNAAVNTLELSDAELDGISANLLRIGSSGGATIAISAPISPAGSSTLHLLSGSSLSQSASAPLTVQNLAINAGGTVGMLQNNDVDTLAIRTTTGNVSYQDSDGFTVGTVNGVAGVGTGSGAVSLTTVAGDLVIGNTAAVADVEATPGFNASIIVFGNGILNVASGANVQGGGASLNADRMDLDGTVTANATVSLTPINTTRLINLGSTTDSGPNTLELSDAELDGITASTLQIGASNGGAITISAPISPANTSTLSLSSGDGVADGNVSGADVTVASLVVDADSVGAFSDRLETAVSSLSATARAGGVFVIDSDGLTISGASSSGAGIFASANGPLTVTGNITASGQTVDLGAFGSGSKLSVATGAAVSGGSVMLNGDRMDLAGSLQATAGAAQLSTVTNGWGADLGSATDAAAGVLELSDAELDRITASGPLVIFSRGATTISSAISPAGASSLTLLTEGALVDGNATGADVSVGSLAIDAHSVGAFGDRLETAVNSLSATARAGGVFVIDSDGLTISGASSSGAGIFASANGPLTVTGNVTASGQTVDLAALGTGSKLTVATGATVSGGSVTLTGDRMDLAGSVQATAGAAQLNTASTGWGADLGSATDAAAGVLELSDAELDRITARGPLVIFSRGATTISSAISPAGAGVLQLLSDGTIGDTNAVGTDFTGGSLVLDGNVAPGTSSPGQLIADSNVTLSSANSFIVQLNGTTPGTEHDQLVVTGAVNLSGATLDVIAGGTLNNGDQFTIVDNAGSGSSTGGGFFRDAMGNTLSEGSEFEVSGNRFIITYQGGTGNDVVLTVANNQPPVAEDDSFSTTEDNAVSGNVLTNDTDPNLSQGDDLDAVLVSGPAHGTLTLDAETGAFTYTPSGNFFGSDTFTYKAVDSQGAESNVATVTITVDEVNDVPLAVDDSAATDEDTPVNGNVLSNDTDPDNTDGIVGNEDDLDAVLVSGPAHGTLTLDAETGAFTYTPNANFFGADSFTYKAVDSDGAESSLATVAIMVNEVNDAPLAVNDSASTTQDTPASGNVLANDSDPDNTDGILGNEDDLDATLVSGPAHGTLTLDAETGAFTYTPNAGFFGTDTFTYKAVDSDGAESAVTTVTITVSPAAPGSIYLIADACDPTKTALVVNGTAGNDNIQVSQTSGGVTVSLNGASQGTYSPTGRIIVYGYGGDDAIQVAGDVPNEAWLYGDAGNDKLNLGNGGGIVFGGAGNDDLRGGSARDILLGGEGADRLVGNASDDILIAALTMYDDRFSFAAHEDAFCHIFKEWKRTDASFQDRVTHLETAEDDGENDFYSLNSSTIYDDASTDQIDVLTGSAGEDWYVYKSGEDKVTGISASESAEAELIP